MSERLLTKSFQAGRYLISALLLASTVMSFVLDWSSNHLLHPGWHPHARFHGALLLFFLAGTSASLLWLLWRGAKDSGAAAGTAVGVLLAYWVPLFFIPFVLPGSTWWAGMPGTEPRWAGLIVYPNLIVAGLMIAAALVGRWLCNVEE